MDQGGNYWTLFTPGIWKVLHAVLHLNGFFNYFAVPMNIEALRGFRKCVEELRRRSLRRRSQKDLTTFERIKKLAKDYLPEPRILHPWPDARFAVKH